MPQAVLAEAAAPPVAVDEVTAPPVLANETAAPPAAINGAAAPLAVADEAAASRSRTRRRNRRKASSTLQGLEAVPESTQVPAPLKWWFSAPPWWPPALLAPPWHPCLPLFPGPLPLHGPGPPSLSLICLRPTSLLDILISGLVFVEHLESASYRVGVVSRSCWCALVGHQM